MAFSSSTERSNSISRQYDHATGQDIAHKLGQEGSGLASKTFGGLYGGDIQGFLESSRRIADIQAYLREFGASPVIPQTRLGQTTIQHGSSSSSQSSRK